MTRALVLMPGRGAAHGVVEVYRDGEEVVCVGRVGALRNALVGRGHVEVSADVVVRFPSVAAFDAEKARAFERHPEKYALAIGAFKSLADDARQAPEIPSDVKEALDGRRLSDALSLETAARERGLPSAIESIRLLTPGEEDEDSPVSSSGQYRGIVEAISCEEAAE